MGFSYKIITQASIEKERLKGVKHLIEPTGLAKILRIKPPKSAMSKIQKIISYQKNHLDDLSKKPVLQGGHYQIESTIIISMENSIQDNRPNYVTKLIGFTNQNG